MLAGTVLAGTTLAGRVLAGTSLAGTALAGTAVAGAMIAGTAVKGAMLAGTAVAGTVLAGTVPAGCRISAGRNRVSLRVGIHLNSAYQNQYLGYAESNAHHWQPQPCCCTLLHAACVQSPPAPACC